MGHLYSVCESAFVWAVLFFGIGMVGYLAYLKSRHLRRRRLRHHSHRGNHSHHSHTIRRTSEAMAGRSPSPEQQP